MEAGREMMGMSLRRSEARTLCAGESTPSRSKAFAGEGQSVLGLNP
jgi:hypothetical protein